LQEVNIIKRINHPNVVKMLEVINDPEHDIVYMVLELLKTGVLMDMTKPETLKQLSEPRACTYFRQMVLALEYLHHNRIVHRDIKPSNLLLADADTIKLTDFGVSHYFEDADTDFVLQKTEGTPAFLAPECCQSDGSGYDARGVDLWAVGATLYCFLFARTPFDGTTAYETYAAILGTPLRLDRVARDKPLSPEVCELLQQLLQKDPEARLKMAQLREHPWVTRFETDPLPPKKENLGTGPLLPVRKSQAFLNTDSLCMPSPIALRGGGAPLLEVHRTGSDTEEVAAEPLLVPAAAPARHGLLWAVVMAKLMLRRHSFALRCRTAANNRVALKVTPHSAWRPHRQGSPQPHGSADSGVGISSTCLVTTTAAIAGLNRPRSSSDLGPRPRAMTANLVDQENRALTRIRKRAAAVAPPEKRDLEPTLEPTTLAVPPEPLAAALGTEPAAPATRIVRSRSLRRMRTKGTPGSRGGGDLGALDECLQAQGLLPPTTSSCSGLTSTIASEGSPTGTSPAFLRALVEGTFAGRQTML
jgi:[calcium/calmodulin-dependent protein kinase] kinase